jgi:multidrug efflux pump subunit AcrB
MSASPIWSAKPPEIIRVAPDPEKLALYGITLQQLAGKVSGANAPFPASRSATTANRSTLMAGRRCSPAPSPTS